MKEFIKKALSSSDDVSSTRIGFLTLICCVVYIVYWYALIAIKGTSWNLPVEIILDKMNTLVSVLVGSGIVSKSLGAVVEYFKDKKEIK